ncbi:MAG: hypothetical protein D6690_04605 [Nitrospirae bacterium]|nr:MAG: hypothetical protein D6690_04605 [Nitrospirota bacterium]
MRYGDAIIFRLAVFLSMLAFPSLAIANHEIPKGHSPSMSGSSPYPTASFFPKQTWGISIRGGSALPSSSFGNDIGYMINGQLFYAIQGPPNTIGGDWNIGIAFQWTRHTNVKDTKIDIEVFTLSPFLEIHSRFNRVSPYITVGAGININAAKDEGAQKPGLDIEMKPSFAFKGGAGIDLFLTDHLALNVEAAWKLNEGAPKFKAGTLSAIQNFDANTVDLLAGLRFIF